MSYTLNYRFPKLVHIVSEAIHYLVSTFFYRVLFFQKTLAAWNPKIDTNFFTHGLLQVIVKFAKALDDMCYWNLSNFKAGLSPSIK